MKVFKERFWRVTFSVLVLLLHVGVVDALAQAQSLPARAVLETVGKLWDKRHSGSPFPRISKALDVSQDDRAKRQTGRSAQQVAASSLASALTSLVDRPSATDFLSIALDSGIFSREEEENLVTFTTSLYGVGSFFNPSMTSSLKEFQDSAYLRRVSIAISTGQADESLMGIMNDDRLNIASFVVKHQFGTRDVRDKHFDNEYKQFEEANRIWSEAISTLFSNPAVVKLVVDIQAGELSPDDIETQFQTQDKLKEAYEKFENKLAKFANLQGKLDEIAKRAGRRWLGSVSFGGKFMEDKPKRYSVQGAVRGYAGSVDVTLNGEFSWTEKGVMGDREVWGGVGIELLRKVEAVSLGKDRLGSNLSFAFNYEDGDHPRIARAQAKWEFPITRGVSIPISVTWANRTELIDEREIRGTFGISYDFSSLLNLRR